MLTEVLKSIFSKVWDSFPGPYSINWRSVGGKFDENPIWTRLEWSWEPKNPGFGKSHEFVLDCCGSGAWRQRRQPLNNSFPESAVPYEAAALTDSWHSASFVKSRNFEHMDYVIF